MEKDFLKKIINSLFKTLEKLEEREVYINNLNVFPVPDGDTGTNMLMTLKETLESTNNDDLENFLNDVSKNIVLKAHGNSGIIFSSFLKGFLNKILNFDSDEANILTEAFENGVEASYKILDNPTEGTILTVIRESVRGMKEGKDLIEKIEKSYIYGLEALEKTKEMLPSLKEADVVDAGGDGFLSFLESIYEVFTDQSIKREKATSSPFNVSIWRKRPVYKNCVELIADKRKEDFNIKEKLKKLGDSIILVEDNEKIKIHIHTNEVDELLKLVNEVGEIKEINIRNMIKQQLEFLLDVEIAVITFSIGENIRELFYSLGASIVIDKDENLSYKDLVEIINDMPSQNIILLPNDKEILFKFEKISELETKKIEIVETLSIPEGIEALLNFDREKSFDENILNMRENIKKIKSGFIDISKENLSMKDFEIKEGDFFATINDEIIVKGENLFKTIANLLNKIEIYEGSLLLIYGDEIDSDEVKKVKIELKKDFPNLNVEIYNGGKRINKIIYSIK